MTCHTKAHANSRIVTIGFTAAMHILLMLSLVIAFPASAADKSGHDAEVIRVEVQHNDLNLVSSPGRATFEKRITNAIRQVCDHGVTRSIRVASQMRRCMAEKKAEIAEAKALILAEALERAPGAQSAHANPKAQAKFDREP